MRDLIKVCLFGIMMLCMSSAYASNEYKVLVLPDNIVTDTIAVDSYIYNEASEFFANEVINILNQTDLIKCPTVTEERELLKSDPSYMIPAKNLTNKFRTTYNIDYPNLKKVASKNQSKYVLLLTSTLDAENYIMRRTLWDFLNIPGATVIDPAYKINTYAALVDVSNNTVPWSKTFYKTISTVESRIITRGPSPQTEQLNKIRDYSQILCPEIAENVQVNVLSPSDFNKETNKIYYDMANFDNVFTKKYRRWYKEGRKDFNGAKGNTKAKIKASKERRREKQAQKELKKSMEVKAEQVNSTQTNEIQKIKENNPTKIIQPLDFEDQSLFEPIYLKRSRKNRLIENTDPLKPALRDYDKL